MKPGALYKVRISTKSTVFDLKKDMVDYYQNTNDILIKRNDLVMYIKQDQGYHNDYFGIVLHIRSNKIIFLHKELYAKI